ncbi:MAG: IS110 family transposase [Candidatus Marinimicrobia bacterium]|nr:IS110 family transposase [Candidatus Neomarinimicrobiota bacterium]
MNQQQLDKNRKWIAGKYIVGIDPAKEKHQATIIDSNGNLVGKSFSFRKDPNGFNNRLWFKLNQYLDPDLINPEHLVFAVEASIDFWQALVDYLHRQHYTVVIVSPLTTKHSRALPGHDFSRTDPKDARLVAESAFRGHFHRYIDYSDHVKALKTLSLTYNKIRKDLSRNQLRLRSMLNRIFPEFLTNLPLDTETAYFLLSKYLHPQDFLDLDVADTVPKMLSVSNQQHGIETLRNLQKAAETSIGIPRDKYEIISDRLTVDSWLTLINTHKQQLKIISAQLIELAKQTPYFDIIISIKGISDLTAALFIAEVKDLNLYCHYKQIQKLAGLNLRLCVSGKSRGRFKINKIGNCRLRWIVYLMTQETIKYIPEVRIKYLKRQIKHSSRTRSIIACSSQLLQLLMALIKANRHYEFIPENQSLVWQLEYQYYKTKKNRKRNKVTPVYNI